MRCNGECEVEGVVIRFTLRVVVKDIAGFFVVAWDEWVRVVMEEVYGVEEWVPRSESVREVGVLGLFHVFR